MAYQKFLCFSIICFLSTSSFTQVNFLKGENWEEARALSVTSGKSIFIDFYTTWCGPCKMMDKNTFSDSIVSDLMNEHFICLKIDAEKKININLVKQYNIKAYPSFVFIDKKGELITKEVGYKSPEAFLNICTNLFDFVMEEGPFSTLSEEYIEGLSEEDLDTFLSKYTHYNFDGKAAIKRKYYNQLKTGEDISINAFEFLLANYEWGDEYSLLSNMIPEKISPFDHNNWNRYYTKLYEEIFNNAIKNGDREAFDNISINYLKVHDELYNAVPALFRTQSLDHTKEIRTQRLKFFLKNQHLDEYFTLADSLISEYILPYDAETVKRRDSFSIKMMEAINKTIENIEPSETKKEFSLRDRLHTNHSNSLDLIARLNEISENIVLLAPQQEKLLKSLEWMDRSIAYLDLPESRIIRAAILKKLEREEEGNDELVLAKKSIYFDEKCTAVLSRLKL